jgi:hypothetical protein
MHRKNFRIFLCHGKNKCLGHSFLKTEIGKEGIMSSIFKILLIIGCLLLLARS